MPSSGFSNYSEENGVTVFFEQEITLGELRVLYQKWHTDDVAGDSVIFVNDDIVEMSDRQLEELVRTSPLLQEGAEVALKRSKYFTAVNFNQKRV